MKRKPTETRRARLWPRLVLVGAATTVIGVAGFAGVSAAHTPSVTPSCSGLDVSLSIYEGDASNNTVTVTIDGTARTFGFGSGFADSFGWSSTEDHTWSVEVDANITTGDQELFDWSRSGTQRRCVEPTTTVPETTVPETTVPETTVPETTVPETTVPETTIPDTTVPETTVPQTTVPQTTVPVCAGEDASAAICAPAVVEVRPQAVAPAAVDPSATTTSLDVSTATLPETGSSTGIQLAIALTAFAAGTALVVFARRRRQASPDA